MNHEYEMDARERLTQLWLEAEPSVQAHLELPREVLP